MQLKNKIKNQYQNFQALSFSRVSTGILQVQSEYSPELCAILSAYCYCDFIVIIIVIIIIIIVVIMIDIMIISETKQC